MTVGLSIDPARFLKEELAEASPDLLRELLTTFVNALLSAQADSVRRCPGSLLRGGGLGVCQRRFRLGRGGCRRVEPTAFGWSMIGVAAFTVLVMVLAALAELVAWVAAVVDTAELPDKTWFIVLLVTGLVGVGFVAMIATWSTDRTAGGRTSHPLRLDQATRRVNSIAGATGSSG
jgi:hypothetical protein